MARGGAHLSPVTLSEIEQAAARNGYPADAEPRGDWLLLRSPWTAHGLLATHDGTRFLVANSAVPALIVFRMGLDHRPG